LTKDLSVFMPHKLTSIIDRNREKNTRPHFPHRCESFSGGTFLLLPVCRAARQKGLIVPALQVSTHLVGPPPLLFAA
jgi:hypothetical protein